MNGNYPIRNKQFGEERKKRTYTVHELSPPSPFSPPFAFRPLVLVFRPQGGDIAHFEKHCSRYKQVVTPTSDNDRDASSTCLSDSFLAVCLHNQSDEDLAMSIKYGRVPFRLVLTNC